MNTNFKGMAKELNEIMDEAMKMALSAMDLDMMAEMAEDETTVKTFSLMMKAMKVSKDATTGMCDFYDTMDKKIATIERNMGLAIENQKILLLHMAELHTKLDKITKKLDKPEVKED